MSSNVVDQMFDNQKNVGFFLDEILWVGLGSGLGLGLGLVP